MEREKDDLILAPCALGIKRPKAAQILSDSKSIRLCLNLSEYNQVLLLSIAAALPLLKTMAIRHADIINNAWQPLSEMTNKK